MTRVDRWRARLLLLGQGGVASGCAWWVASGPLGHDSPFFAPVAALLVLGISHAQRTQRARQVALGVAIGVGVGDLGVHLLGSGAWQLVLITFVSMSLATLVNAGPTITVQAGVQSLIVATLSPSISQGLDRWVDALVGCLLALAVAALTPSDLLTRPRVLTARLLDRTSLVLRELSAALAEADRDRARAALTQLGELDLAVQHLNEVRREMVSAARHSVLRRSALVRVAPYARLPSAVARLVGDLGVLARRVDIALWRGEEVPLSCHRSLDELAEVTELMAGELWNRRLPSRPRPHLLRIARRSADLPLGPSLSSSVIVAQIRSVLTDLLMVSGLSLDESREVIPDMSARRVDP